MSRHGNRESSTKFLQTDLKVAALLHARTCHHIAGGLGPVSRSSSTIFKVCVPRLFANVCTNSRAGMGFDAIWISPMVSNTPNGYHGYWMQDLYGFNPHFGSKSDLQSLIQACHSRNMFVMLDVVGNHVGQVDMYVRQADVCGRVLSVLARCHSRLHAGTSHK